MRFWSWMVSLVHRRRAKQRIPHRPAWWRRWRRLPPLMRRGMLLVALGALPGCERIDLPAPWRHALTKAGLLESTPQPPLLLDGICDISEGAPCDRTRFERAVTATAQLAAGREGTIVRWWMLGATAATTVSLGEKMSPALPPRGARAQAAATSVFVKETTEYFLAAAERHFLAKPLRASPLHAALGRVAVSDTHGLMRRILFVTDLKEVSDALDLECLGTRRLPKPDAWAERVANRRLIAPGSLTGTEVVFAFTSLTPTLRPSACPTASVERTLIAQELWEAALRRSGAARVVFASGLPDLVPLAKEGR